ncbi:uncharacterized protein LOC102807889 [Saccoglossus kowalevskii]|uniref:Oocyte zinc finger protein XlCOF7.1-like n=1 Tax=Saccoglossus kowalevskii TaxID=10224 RepID=A0ABM0LV38_SACKO|nr:PREDICTED: oocyte zinc finger protein XlCOF7.1-like [Saccoglossus kowalevskii]
MEPENAEQSGMVAESHLEGTEEVNTVESSNADSCGATPKEKDVASSNEKDETKDGLDEIASQSSSEESPANENGKKESEQQKANSKSERRRRNRQEIQVVHTCDVCNDNTFPSLAALGNHMKTEHGKSLDVEYSCKFCKQTYRRRRPFVVHCKEMHKKEIHACRHCTQSFNMQNALDMHCEEEHMPFPRKCTQCNEMLVDKGVLKSHFTKNHPHECNRCTKWFTQKSELEEHRKKEHPATIPCTICNHTFVTKSALEEHCKDHHKKKLGCNRCSRVFTSKDSLERHTKAVHTPLPKCLSCGSIFSNQDMLRQHYASRHRGQAAGYTSPMQVSRGHYSDKYSMHVRRAAGQPLLPDPVYYQSQFQDNESMQKNMMMVPGTRTCIHCGLSFINEASLDQHCRDEHSVLPSSGVGPTYCLYCGQLFGSQVGLHKHYSVKHGTTPPISHASTGHDYDGRQQRLDSMQYTRPQSASAATGSTGSTMTRVGPASCSFCGQMFASQVGLQKHCRAKHGDFVRAAEMNETYTWQKGMQQRSLPCVFCRQNFMQPQALEHHYRNQHQVPYVYTCNDCCAPFTTPGALIQHTEGHIIAARSTAPSLLNLPLSQNPGWNQLGAQAGFTMVNQGFGYNSRNIRKRRQEEGGAKPSSCPVCQLTFMSRGAMQNHLKDSHDKQAHLVCIPCGRLFKDRNELDKHYTSKHSIEEHFAKKKGLKKQEVQGRSGKTSKKKQETMPQKQDKKFEARMDLKCRDCSKAFSTMEVLKQHIKTKCETNKETIICCQCRRPFKSCVDLERHVIHKHMTKFQCSECNKSFITKEYLEQHNNNKHMTEYPCNECVKVFKNRQGLKTHSRNAHNISTKDLVSVVRHKTAKPDEPKEQESEDEEDKEEEGQTPAAQPDEYQDVLAQFEDGQAHSETITADTPETESILIESEDAAAVEDNGIPVCLDTELLVQDPDALNKYVNSHLCPTEEEDYRCNQAVMHLTSIIESNSGLKLKYFLKGGPFGRGTNLKGTSDVKLILFLEEYSNLGEFKEGMTKILQNIKSSLTATDDANLEVIEEMPTSLKVQIKNSTDGDVGQVELIPAFDVLGKEPTKDDKGKIYQSILAESDAEKLAYSTHLTHLQLDFFKEIPPQVKNLSRLVKYWLNSLCEANSIDKSTMPSEYMLELITIDTWEETGEKIRFDMADGLRAVLQRFMSYDAVEVEWFVNCREDLAEKIHSIVKPTRPIIYDPANPLINVCADCNKWDEVARLAVGSLSSPLLCLKK